jgi:hypothetical protein
MTQRLKSAGLAILILVLGMSLIVVATEYEGGADASEPRLLTVGDLVTTLDEQGVVIEPERSPAHHPLLGVAGTTIWVAASSIEVYSYPDVTSRVADEQVLQRHIMQLEAFSSDGNPGLRVTSARNLLLLFYVESPDHAALVYEAARTLASAAES